MTTPYQLLGLPASADRDDLRAAYRRQARLWHPDVNRSEIAAARFRAIAAAYELLCDPARRAALDAELVAETGRPQIEAVSARPNPYAGRYQTVDAEPEQQTFDARVY